MVAVVGSRRHKGFGFLRFLLLAGRAFSLVEARTLGTFVVLEVRLGRLDLVSLSGASMERKVPVVETGGDLGFARLGRLQRLAVRGGNSAVLSPDAELLVEQLSIFPQPFDPVVAAVVVAAAAADTAAAAVAAAVAAAAAVVVATAVVVAVVVAATVVVVAVAAGATVAGVDPIAVVGLVVGGERHRDLVSCAGDRFPA